MNHRIRSYLTNYLSTRSHRLALAVLVLAATMVNASRAAEIFLDPNPVFVTQGVGSEFDLELRVDETTLDLRLYQVYIRFEPSMLDTVAITLGPLFENSGYPQFFNYDFVQDSATGDTALKVEALLLGPTSAVDGPGVVATIRLRTLANGIADLSILKHQLADIYGNIIEGSSALGTIAYMNTPPDSFNLLDPGEGESVTAFPDETVTFNWGTSGSVYPGEGVTYILEYSRSPAFEPAQTTTVPGLTSTTYGVLSGELEEGTYYWRVIASGDIYGFEQFSNPYPGTFDFSLEVVAPQEFDLISPESDGLVNLFGKSQVVFDWEDAVGIPPGDDITYTFYLGPTSSFPGSETISVTTDASQTEIDATDLVTCEQQYWSVVAVNNYEMSTWSTSVFSVLFIYRGDLDCSGDAGSPIDISDLTYFVDYLFGGGPPPVIYDAGDLNCSAEVAVADISDLTFLVDYLFGGGPPPTCDG